MGHRATSRGEGHKLWANSWAGLCHGLGAHLKARTSLRFDAVWWLILCRSALTQSKAKEAALLRHPVTAAVPSTVGDSTAADEMAMLRVLACQCCDPSLTPLAWHMGLPNWPSPARVQSADMNLIG